MQKDHINRYAFVSLSAGTNGVTPHVEHELLKYIGRKPDALVHLLLSDLLPYDKRGNQKLLNAFRVSVEDADTLVESAAQQIEKSISVN